MRILPFYLFVLSLFILPLLFYILACYGGDIFDSKAIIDNGQNTSVTNQTSTINSSTSYSTNPTENSTTYISTSTIFTTTTTTTMATAMTTTTTTTTTSTTTSVNYTAYTCSFTFGSPGTGPGEFVELFDIDIDETSDEMYVVDMGANRVQKFSLEGTYIDCVGRNGCDASSGSGDGEFTSPVGICLIKSLNIFFVGDNQNHRIQRFDLLMNYETKFGANGGDSTSGTANGEFQNVQGVAADNYNKVYVGEWFNHRVQKLNHNGTFLLKWGANGGDGTSGTSDGEFTNVSMIGIDINNDWVYVADTGNSRIQKFTIDGTFVTKFGGTVGTGDGEMDNPYGIAVDKFGFVYVADYGNHRIQKFDWNGNFICKFGANGGDGTSGSAAGEFNQPLGVYVMDDGSIYITDRGNDRIQFFNPLP